MVSKRIQTLLEEINAVPSVYEGTDFDMVALAPYQGKEPFHETWMANEAAPFDIRLARAQAAYRASVPAEVIPNQLIAGSLLPEAIIYYGSGVFTWDFQLNEALAARHPQGDAIVSYWKKYLDGRPPRGIYDNPTPAFAAAYAVVYISCHSTMDFSIAMEGGLNGLREKIARYQPEHPEAADWYEAVKISLDGVSAYLLAHAEAYEAAGAENPEYAAIGANCRYLAEGHAPETFHQACQLFWTLFYLNGHDSPGRIDRYLGPALQRDLDRGTITLEEAQEICDCLYCKMAKLVAYGSTLGGQTPEGEDSTNAMTWLCLSSIDRLHLLSPRTSFRVHQNTPPELLLEAVRTCAGGATYPTFINDEVVIPSMVARGSVLEDARDYTFCGCGQVVHNGRAFGGHEGAVLDTPKALTFTLHRGRDELTGEQNGIDLGPLDSFDTYEKLEAAVLRQLENMLKLLVDEVARARAWGEKYMPDFLRSVLVHGCLETGKDFRRGGAKYNPDMIDTVAVTTLADSLTAIRHVVYHDRLCTLQALTAACDANWQGYEELHQACLHAPKFGNNIDDADSTMAMLVSFINRTLDGCSTYFGGPWGIDINGWSGAVNLGRHTGATPDGRFSSEPIADCAGPSQGRDTCGITNVLHSMAKLDFHGSHGPLVLSAKFTPQTVLGENLPKLRDLLLTYFAMGGMQFQPTVASAEDMKAALLEPEKWRDLIVRVGGFSAKFVDLKPDWQADMIRRTENGL